MSRKTPFITGARMRSDSRLREPLLLLYDWMPVVLSSQRAAHGRLRHADGVSTKPVVLKACREEHFGGGEKGSQTVRLTFTGLCPHI